MKKYYFIVVILSAMNANAQSGKVGVNTATPTEVFSVNGTTRVQELPVNGSANSVYTKADGTASTTKNQTFTATKTVVADANGVLGVVNALPGSASNGLPVYGASSTIVKGGTQWGTHQAVSGDQCLQVSLYPFQAGLTKYTQFDVYVRLNPDSGKCSGKTTSWGVFQWVGGDDLGTQNKYWRGDVTTAWTRIEQNYYTDRSVLFTGSAILWDVPQSYSWGFGSNNGSNGSQPYDLYTMVERKY